MRIHSGTSDRSALQAGTTLLIALPLGAVLCFLDLLGARAFARGEAGPSCFIAAIVLKRVFQLALQSRFHSPLAYPPPYPPRPIFTRSRPPTPTELELGLTVVPEASFYKNTYAMVCLLICVPSTTKLFISSLPTRRPTKLYSTSLSLNRASPLFYPSVYSFLCHLLLFSSSPLPLYLELSGNWVLGRQM